MSDVARRSLRNLKQTGSVHHWRSRRRLVLMLLPHPEEETFVAADGGAEVADEVVAGIKDVEVEAQIPNAICVEKLDIFKVSVQRAKNSRNG
ncbi:hypothetical protein BSKO_05542 [Bryopsis sp. KO-2023]|nr:hypothetical protein BSKO_05542 [Bryopsis sp. KO-2023]